MEKDAAAVKAAGTRVNGGAPLDPLEALRKRHDYLVHRTERTFAIPGYLGRFGMKLRALDRSEIREISKQTVRLAQEGHEDPELIDNTDTLIRACEAVMYRPDDDTDWKGLHEFPSAETANPVRFDTTLADLFEVADQIDRSDGAEAESRQVLWLVFTDTWRVSQAHDDYIMWRTFATEDAADEVAEGLRAEVEDESGEAVSAT